MLLTELLDHDLHRSRGGELRTYSLHVPVHKDSFPLVVSTTRGKFIVSTRPWGDGLAGIGIFDYDSEKLDALIGPMVSAAFTLSKGSSYMVSERDVVDGKQVGEKKDRSYSGTYDNSFSGPGAAKRAFEYVQENSGLKAQPHACLLPSSWDEKKASSFLGKGYDPAKRKLSGCRVIFHDVPMPTFFSRPDMVGLYTQFLNGGVAIILHNVELGMSFCPQE